MNYLGFLAVELASFPELDQLYAPAPAEDILRLQAMLPAAYEFPLAVREYLEIMGSNKLLNFNLSSTTFLFYTISTNSPRPSDLICEQPLVCYTLNSFRSDAWKKKSDGKWTPNRIRGVEK